MEQFKYIVGNPKSIDLSVVVLGKWCLVSEYRKDTGEWHYYEFNKVTKKVKEDFKKLLLSDKMIKDIENAMTNDKIIYKDTTNQRQRILYALNDIEPMKIATPLENEMSIIRSYVCNYTKDEKVLKKLAKDSDKVIRRLVAKRGIASVNKLLINDKDHEVRYNIVSSTNDTNILKSFIKDPNEDMRIAMASHTNEDILKLMYNDKFVKVREQVACHYYPSILKKMLNDKEESVRVAIACHNDLNLLKVLVKDSRANVRNEVAKHKHENLIKILLNDKSSIVKATAKLHATKGSKFEFVFKPKMPKITKKAKATTKKVATKNKDVTVDELFG